MSSKKSASQEQKFPENKKHNFKINIHLEDTSCSFYHFRHIIHSKSDFSMASSGQSQSFESEDFTILAWVML